MAWELEEDMAREKTIGDFTQLLARLDRVLDLAERALALQDRTPDDEPLNTGERLHLAAARWPGALSARAAYRPYPVFGSEGDQLGVERVAE